MKSISNSFIIVIVLVLILGFGSACEISSLPDLQEPGGKTAVLSLTIKGKDSSARIPGSVLH
jgi:hypothetical protein